MPIRSFRTAEGVHWQVWNVMPGRRDVVERRLGTDRRSPDPVFRYTGPERRKAADRRRPALFLSPLLAAGWLTFECPTEKRRLAPIPPHWEQLSEADLQRLCDTARRVVLPPIPPGPTQTD